MSTHLASKDDQKALLENYIKVLEEIIEDHIPAYAILRCACFSVMASRDAVLLHGSQASMNHVYALLADAIMEADMLAGKVMPAEESGLYAKYYNCCGRILTKEERTKVGCPICSKL